MRLYGAVRFFFSARRALRWRFTRVDGAGTQTGRIEGVVSRYRYSEANRRRARFLPLKNGFTRNFRRDLSRRLATNRSKRR